MSSALDAFGDNVEPLYASRPFRSIDFMDKAGEFFDYTLCAISSVGFLTSAKELTDKCNQGRMMVGVVRVISALKNLFTLSFIYQHNSNGSIKTNKEGQKLYNHWIDVSAILSLIAGRILCVVNAIHTFKIADFGKHAKNIGHATTVAFTALTTFGMISAIRDFFLSFKKQEEGEEEAEAVKDAFVKLVKSGAYAMMTLTESGALLAASRTAGIIGASIALLGSLTILACEIFQLNSFEVSKDILAG